jgi:hypothetical protein
MVTDRRCKAFKSRDKCQDSSRGNGLLRTKKELRKNKKDEEEGKPSSSAFSSFFGLQTESFKRQKRKPRVALG